MSTRANSSRPVHIAVAGATGAVGREMLRALEQADLEVASVRALASERSEGRVLEYAGQPITVERLRPEAFSGIDIALFSCGGGRSLEFAPHAVAAGAVVVDNSSAFRQDPEVPLVVPEVNMDAARAHKGIIANPNCSTIQMVLPLKALADGPGLERVIVSTYQSASGAGQSGVDELREATAMSLAGETPPAEVFAHPLAFEVLPHIGSFEDSGYTTEELKMTYETRKIMGLPNLEVSATCVRVPVFRAHSESVTVDLGRATTEEQAKALFSAIDGLVVTDDPARNIYPLARVAEGRNETFVGRIRRDIDRPRTMHFWVVSDNLLKGAAYNAVQIAEYLVARGIV